MTTFSQYTCSYQMQHCCTGMTNDGMLVHLSSCLRALCRRVTQWGMLYSCRPEDVSKAGKQAQSWSRPCSLQPLGYVVCWCPLARWKLLVHDTHMHRKAPDFKLASWPDMSLSLASPSAVLAAEGLGLPDACRTTPSCECPGPSPPCIAWRPWPAQYTAVYAMPAR